MASNIFSNAALPESWWSNRIVTHYEAQYSWIALWFADETIVIFSVAEAIAGKWFEVFPLTVETSLPEYLRNYTFKPVALSAPFHVVRVASLWRDEWLEASVDSSQFMGAGPHSVQYAAPAGAAPATAHAVTIHAGIACESMAGNRLVICSSDNSPFLIDFAAEAVDVDAILRFHTIR